MTSRLAFRSAVTDALDTRAPDQHRVRSTEACICFACRPKHSFGQGVWQYLKVSGNGIYFP